MPPEYAVFYGWPGPIESPVTIGHLGLRRSRFVLIPESGRLVRAEKLGIGRIPSRVAAAMWRLPSEFSRVVVRGLTT